MSIVSTGAAVYALKKRVVGHAQPVEYNAASMLRLVGAVGAR